MMRRKKINDGEVPADSPEYQIEVWQIGPYEWTYHLDHLVRTYNKHTGKRYSIYSPTGYKDSGFASEQAAVEAARAQIDLIRQQRQWVQQRKVYTA
jgi:hypothetical protein